MRGIDLSLIVASPKLAPSTRDEHNFVHVVEYPSPSASRLKGLSRAGVCVAFRNVGRKTSD
jgi:hypothetical protein